MIASKKPGAKGKLRASAFMGATKFSTPYSLALFHPVAMVSHPSHSSKSTEYTWTPNSRARKILVIPFPQARLRTRCFMTGQIALLPCQIICCYRPKQCYKFSYKCPPEIYFSGSLLIVHGYHISIIQLPG